MDTLLRHIIFVVLISQYCEAQTSPSTCTGGFWLTVSNDNNAGIRNIYSGPFPQASSMDDFDMLVPSISTIDNPNFIAFDRTTSTVYWGLPGTASSGDVISRQTITNVMPSPGPSTFITGTQHATTDFDITAMTFDEAKQRAYWSETDGTITRTLWFVPNNAVNDDKVMVYTYASTSGEVISDIEIDSENRFIYWADGVVYRAEINEDGTISSVNTVDVNIIDAMRVISIELDLVSRKLYWSVGCSIGRIDLDTLELASNEVYSPDTGGCAATWTDLFLSVSEGYIYGIDDALGDVLKTPLSSPTPISTMEISLVGFTSPRVYLVPSCPLEITLSASQYTVTEGTMDFGIQVNRLGSIYDDPIVYVRYYGKYGNHDDSATTPNDYASFVNGIVRSSGSIAIQFESAQSSVEVPFLIYADELTERNETFIVELHDPSYERFKLGKIPKAEVTIIDESSYFRFKRSSYEAREGEGTIPITIERVGYAEEYAEVSLIATGETAEAGADFNPVIATVVFNPYQVEAEAFITITDDQELESTETFDVSFAQKQPTDDDSIEISIKDNEIGFSFLKAVYEVNEDAETVIIPVERIGANELEGQVNLVIGDASDSARRGEEEDYTEFNPTTLTFRAGQTIANIYVNINDDTLYESIESFKISISDPQPDGSDIDIETTTISIMDNEENLRFEDNTFTAREGDNAPIRIPIIRDVALKDTSVFVTTCQLYRSAVGGEDYVPIASGIVRFPLGQTTAHAPDIYILNDNQGEVYESFRVIITSQNQAVCNDEVTSDIYVGIIDDDGVTYRFTSDNYVIEESSANLKVRIDGDGIPPDDPERVSLTATSGSATINEDFRFIGPLTLNFGNKGYTEVLIQIAGDTEYEPEDETFNLILTNSAGETLDIATVTIIDDDNPLTPLQPQAYRFSEVSTTVSESDNAVNIRVFRTQTSGQATVLINTISGSAQEGTDYHALSSIPLVFSAGTVLVDQVVDIINDEDLEGDESFQISLSSPSDGGTIVGGAMTVTIKDDDEDETGSALSTPVVIAIVAGIIVAVLIFGILICVCLVSLLRSTTTKPIGLTPQPYGRSINY